MAVDTKPNLSNNKFEQCVGDVLNLSGNTNVSGTLELTSGATLSIVSNRGVGKVLTSDINGFATWQVAGSGAGVTGATNGLSVNSASQVGLGGTLTGDTTINMGPYNLCALGTGGVIMTGSSVLLGGNNTCLLLVGGGFGTGFHFWVDNGASPVAMTMLNGANGLIYGGCYSTGFTNNLSIVDKGYVDNAIWTSGGTSGGTVTAADNGLTLVGSTIVLGGTLTGTTRICTGVNWSNSHGLAIGLGTSMYATGKNSLALGYNTHATGNNSIAGGYNSCAYGYNSMAIGYNNITYGYYSVALGYCNSTTANHSMAIGHCTKAHGCGSLATGSRTCTGYESDNSVTIGCYTNIYGDNSKNSLAGGCRSTVYGFNSIAFGNNAYAYGDNSIVLGNHGRVNSHNSAILGGLYSYLYGCYSGIIGGKNNRIYGYNNCSVLLGGYNITIPDSALPNHAIVPSLAIWNTPPTGDTGAGDLQLVWNSTDKKVKTVAGGGGGSGFTTAANGLTGSGSTVCLGGTLDGSTTIDLGGSNLLLGSIVAGPYVDVNAAGGHVSINADASVGIFVKSSTDEISLNTNGGGHVQITGNTIRSSGNFGFKGIEYVDDYSLNYTDRSLVDRAYVLSVATGGTGGSGFTVATNGLNSTGSSSTVCLGGLLNQYTSIDVDTFTFGICESNSNLGLIVCGSGNVTIGDTTMLTDGAYLLVDTGNGAHSILAQGCSTNFIKVDGGNNCIQIENGTSCVDMFGQSLKLTNSDTCMTFDTGVITLSGGSTNIYSTVCLTTPNNGTCDDSVLVWNSEFGEIKIVPYISGGTGGTAGATLSEFTITGDSSTTGFTINHAKNKQFVGVEIIRNLDPYPTVYTDVYRTDANNVCVTFDTAPTTGLEYKILIIS